MSREREPAGEIAARRGGRDGRAARGRRPESSFARLGNARADALALAAVALFFVCFFPQAVFGGKFLIAGDAYYYSMPLRAVAWGMVRAGEWPLWTPHVLSGFPLLAMPQLALGYPLTWGHAVLPAHWAEQLYVLAPYLLAPAFTYAYARELGRTRPAALLAGLAFTYGGAMCGGISNSGMLTNGMMWLPLALLGLERARRGRLAACLLGAALACAMSLLNGHAQTFTYAALLVGAYGLFLSLFARGAVAGGGAGGAGGGAVEDGGAGEGGGAAVGPGRTTGPWRRWQPLAVACGAVALAAGVAGFQLFETARAARRSTRGAPTYETLAEGSFRPSEAARALFAPLHALADVTPYVAPLALALAAFALFAAASGDGRGRDARVFFWAGVAVVAWLLMLGGNTPLQRVIFHLPALNRFRVPSRHAFEWTFAVSVLAAYGFDQLSARFARRRESARAREEVADATTSGAPALAARIMPALASRDAPGLAPHGAHGAGKPDTRDRRFVIVSFALAAAAAVVGALWWRAAQTPPAPGSRLDTGLAEPAYLYWKLAFTSLLFASAFFGWRIGDARRRAGLLAACVLLGCFVEPNAFVWRKWGRLALDAGRFAAVSEVTRGLQREPPEAGRVYTRVDLFVEEFARRPRLEGPNLTALHGLHNVAGVEPLIQERYSRALGGVGPDSVTPRAGRAPNLSLFGPRSRVLDLLNTTHVVSFTNLQTSPAPDAARDGVNFSRADLGLALRPGARAELDGARFESDALAVVSSLSDAGAEEQGAEVARLRVRTVGGRTFELALRAGVDTAEWAHERADVRPHVKHALAPVYESRPGDEANSFSAYSYLARVPLAERAAVERIEIENVSRRAWLMVAKASLSDASRASSLPLHPPLDAKWERICDAEGTLVLRNSRAQPRAWLVAEVESVDGEEALRRIAGESPTEFDPRRTALLEVEPAELPRLPGGELAAGSVARVVEYGANALTVETESPTAALLVVSEMFYPGWEAEVDGRGARIHLTDYLLRGVSVPAGRHRVEMRYRSTAARNGAIISALSLGCLFALALLTRRSRRRRGAATRG